MLPFADDPTPAARPTEAGAAAADAPADPTAPLPEPDSPEPHRRSIGEEINTMLTLLLPWAISILLHFGIVLLAFFVVWGVGAPVEEEEEIIPEARFMNEAPSEMLVYSEQLEVTATAEVPREIQTQEVAQGDPLSELNTETAQDIALIGVSGSKALPAGSKIGKDPLGVGFYGAGGNARTIVYAVDASGSLVDSLPFVINELKDSLRQLSAEQRFTVIFFQRDTAIEVPVPHRGLKVADAETVKRVSDWISLENGNITPRGSSNPQKAIEIGLGYRPDLMYILSDNITGAGPYAIEQSALLERIEQVKRQRGARTKINTIQFLYPDPLNTLEMIAEQHGGRYRFVDASVVGLR
jgi:hypothetical protein